MKLHYTPRAPTSNHYGYNYPSRSHRRVIPVHHLVEGSDEWLWRLYIEQEDLKSHADEENFLHCVVDRADNVMAVLLGSREVESRYARTARLDLEKKQKEESKEQARQARLRREHKAWLVECKRREKEAEEAEVRRRQEIVDSIRSRPPAKRDPQPRVSEILRKSGFTQEPSSESWRSPKGISPDARVVVLRPYPPRDRTPEPAPSESRE